MRHATRRPARGFTLAEVATACALAGVLAALAVPGLRQQQHAAGRLDAVEALTRVQTAQARHHAAHGLYAAELAQLGGGAGTPTSPRGRYRIAMEIDGPDRYVARATARDDGPQAADEACREIVVRGHAGFVEHGPNARCWGR